MIDSTTHIVVRGTNQAVHSESRRLPNPLWLGHFSFLPPIGSIAVGPSFLYPKRIGGGERGEGENQRKRSQRQGINIPGFKGNYVVLWEDRKRGLKGRERTHPAGKPVKARVCKGGRPVATGSSCQACFDVGKGGWSQLDDGEGVFSLLQAISFPLPSLPPIKGLPGAMISNCT